jgi:hypothetical protein
VRSIGHAGTLDPGASGLLLACVGRATKIVQFLTRYDKEYEAVIRLGLATDTYDGEGKVTAEYSGDLPDANRIREVLFSFRGRMLQTPPPYSAVKHKGRKLYQYARAQEKVKVNPRNIHPEPGLGDRGEVGMWRPPFGVAQNRGWSLPAGRCPFPGRAGGNLSRRRYIHGHGAHRGNAFSPSPGDGEEGILR